VAAPASIRISGSVANSDQANGARTIPARNNRPQATSPRTGRSRPPTMPLMPAMRPLSRMKRDAARPISMAPISAVHGVK